MNDLQRQYQAVVLNGRGGVLVDEPFRLEVSFGPVLTRQESLNLPPGEQRRLESTASPLRTEGSVPFPVHFTIP
jgi:hypothetical protein